jgi:hypothetical protein
MDFKRSAFTPFFRRFTDERAKDSGELRELYLRVQALHRSSRTGKEYANFDLCNELFADLKVALPGTVESAFLEVIFGLLSYEACMFELPAPDWQHHTLTLKEATDLRHFLRAKEHFHAHEARVLALLRRAVDRLFGSVAHRLPQSYAPSPFTIPLVCSLPEPSQFMDQVFQELMQDDYRDAGLFVEVFNRLWSNVCAASGIADPFSPPKKPVKYPSALDAPLEERVETYFKGTPFHDFLLAPIPLRFTHEERFSHTHIVGGSGAGKTTLLQNLILNDLKSDDPPSLVIVDSQGDLINRIARLGLFDPMGGALGDRLVLVSPKDVRYPPALNIFDVNRDRLGGYDEATKEQVVAGVIQTFDYLFTGLLGADLTAKQGVFFRFVARLMLALPETLGRSATILDMLRLMDDATPYKDAIASLPPIQREFFERDFASKTFAQTKEQIRYRLNAILENPTLARLFTAPRTKLDLFDTLNKGGIVLVDTAKDFLKGSSAHFGRIFISLVLQAVLERAAIPEHRRKATFLIVDEAAAYFDSNIDDLLTEARKYKCGCVFAHQFLDQASSALRASLAANTAIKLAGGVSNADARALASDMRTTADFILSQPRLHFACHVRNVTPGAVSVPVAVGQLEAEPALDDDQYDTLLAFNRLKVSLTDEERDVAKPAAPSPHAEERPSSERPAEEPPRTKEDPSAASEDW